MSGWPHVFGDHNETSYLQDRINDIDHQTCRETACRAHVDFDNLIDQCREIARLSACGESSAAQQLFAELPKMAFGLVTEIAQLVHAAQSAVLEQGYHKDEA